MILLSPYKSLDDLLFSISQKKDAIHKKYSTSYLPDLIELMDAQESESMQKMLKDSAYLKEIQEQIF
ncbi:MAG: hypothetical protein WKF85_06620 [Chitinophagaceae bacterium]